MCGSGNGGYVPPQGSKFDCETSQITTTVSSIDLDVLRKLSVGNVLGLEISENKTLILLDGDGEILGCILHLNTIDLIECIENGNEYKAEIISISGPACKVLIQSKINSFAF